MWYSNCLKFVEFIRRIGLYFRYFIAKTYLSLVLTPGLFFDCIIEVSGYLKILLISCARSPDIYLQRQHCDASHVSVR